MAAPTGMPYGMSIGMDHQPSGSCAVCERTDLMSGSPASISAVAETPERSGTGTEPSGRGLHSIRSSVIAVPARIAVAANGNDSL